MLFAYKLALNIAFDLGKIKKNKRKIHITATLDNHGTTFALYICAQLGRFECIDYWDRDPQQLTFAHLTECTRVMLIKKGESDARFIRLMKRYLPLIR